MKSSGSSSDTDRNIIDTTAITNNIVRFVVPLLLKNLSRCSVMKWNSFLLNDLGGKQWNTTPTVQSFNRRLCLFQAGGTTTNTLQKVDLQQVTVYQQACSFLYGILDYSIYAGHICSDTAVIQGACNMCWQATAPSVYCETFITNDVTCSVPLKYLTSDSVIPFTKHSKCASPVICFL